MKAKQRFSTDYYINGLKSGDRYILAQAISLIESHHEIDMKLADEILQSIIPFTGKSIRIGISGVPGAGKSTFIEHFGAYLIGKGKRVAVLAVDPSSSISGGSILGDKTRMESLVNSDKAFIRPSPSAGTLGGVALKTRECIFLCEAANYDCILVETVGVGQSETYVKAMVDFFLLITIAGAGDELQGIKRGIMEIADGIVINKDDGENQIAVQKSYSKLKSVMHYFAKAEHQQEIFVHKISALTQKGFDEVWESILSFIQQVKFTEFFEENRYRQTLSWYHSSINQMIEKWILQNPSIKTNWEALSKAVNMQQISVIEAKRQMELILKKIIKE